MQSLGKRCQDDGANLLVETEQHQWEIMQFDHNYQLPRYVFKTIVPTLRCSLIR